MPDGLRVGFTGHEQEDTLGLVDMRGRYYDPTQRRRAATTEQTTGPTAALGWTTLGLTAVLVRRWDLTMTEPFVGIVTTCAAPI